MPRPTAPSPNAFVSKDGRSEDLVSIQLRPRRHRNDTIVTPPQLLSSIQQGNVVARILDEAREQDIRKPLDWLLAGKQGPAPKQS
ncbi:MAG TPA: hypothetical protein VGT04_02765 [Acidobacteriaceae bacterium]|nr:hypothetical protein [Acidobacteriaceae bacterium]